MKFGYILILFLIYPLMAGTPHVATLSCENKKLVFSKGETILTNKIECYGVKNRNVIPSNWAVYPKLPQGITLEQGKGNNKSKLFLVGAPKMISPWTRYRITASNNGNKIKKIPPATIYISICIKKMKKICYFDNELQMLDIYNPNNISRLPLKSSFHNPISFNHDLFVVLSSTHTNKGFIAVIDGNTEEIIYTRDIPHLARYPIYSNIVSCQNKFYFFADNHNKGRNLFCFSFDRVTRRSSLEEIAVLPISRNPLDVLVCNHYIVARFNGGKLLIFNTINNKITVKTEVNSFTVTDSEVVYVNGLKNTIEIDSFHSKKTIKVEGLSLLYNKKIIYRDSFLYVDAIDPIRGGSFIIPVDSMFTQKSAIAIGDSNIHDMAYGDGFCAIVTNDHFLVVDLGQKKIIHRREYSGIGKLIFYSGFFFLEEAGQTSYFPTHSLYQEEPIKKIINKHLGAVYFFEKNHSPLAIISKRFYGGINYSPAKIRIINSSIENFEKKGHLTATNQKSLAIAEREHLEIYTPTSSKNPTGIHFSSLIWDICYYKNQILIINKDSPYLTILDSHSYQQKQVLLGAIPLKIECKNEKIYMILRNEENDSVSLCVFTVKDLITSGNSDTSEIIFLFTDYSNTLYPQLIIGDSTAFILCENVTYFADLAKKTRKNLNRQPRFIKNLEKDKYIIVRKVEDGLSIKMNATLTALNKEITIPFNYYGPYSFAYGDGYLAVSVASNNLVCLINTDNFSQKKITIRNPGRIFFVKNKFIVQCHSSLALIDSISGERLGSIRYNESISSIFSLGSSFK